MTIEDVRLLCEYNSWANHRALDACAALDPAQFTRNLGSSFPSVRDTLTHIMFAEWVWLERWSGRSPSGFPPEDFLDLASVRARWQKIESDLLRFVRALSAADLDRVVTYRNTKGNPFSDSMWQMLQHLFNHGTYHRGQIATLLRQLGAAPAATDLIAFYREKSGQPHN
ncbi:MAG TPA: DinB family protein [Candidatus Limnocylindrales bacterium]|nr:DinB family protein [Candidatus Limnocylindrales bacterium]